MSMVGVAGFELSTPCTPCKCATRLRYTPKEKIIALPMGNLIQEIAYLKQFTEQKLKLAGVIVISAKLPSIFNTHFI